jgi:hypothetical protein
MLTASSSAIGTLPVGEQPAAWTSVPAPSRKEICRFLRALDPAARSFTFQTFDDDHSNGHDVNASLARSTSNRKEVLQLYTGGAGVYITVNETDLNGRKSENIKRIRAVWQEDDEGHSGPFPLDPSLVVETSPGHFHRYWLVANDWPADEQGRADFASVMERMVASYGCDHRAKDICRVLRIPGFLHRKDPAQPHMIRIVADSGRRYTREEILRAFPRVEREPRREREWRSNDCDEERISEALRAMPTDDRDVWLQIGMALKDELWRSRPCALGQLVGWLEQVQRQRAGENVALAQAQRHRDRDAVLSRAAAWMVTATTRHGWRLAGRISVVFGRFGRSCMAADR